MTQQLRGWEGETEGWGGGTDERWLMGGAMMNRLGNRDQKKKKGMNTYLCAGVGGGVWRRWRQRMTQDRGLSGEQTQTVVAHNEFHTLENKVWIW